MAQIAHDRLEIHRDDRLVLDNQHVGARLALDLLDRLGDQSLDLRGLDLHQIRRVLGGKAFELGQQERLARARRDTGEPGIGNAAFIAGIGIAAIDVVGRLPDALEGAVEAQPHIHVARKILRRRDDRFERLAHVRIAILLGASQCAGVAAQERKVGCEILAERHGVGVLLNYGRLG